MDHILSSWSRSELPGKIGLRMIISPRTQLSSCQSKKLALLEESAPNAPDIDLTAVLTRAKKQLRRTVPPSYHAVGVPTVTTARSSSRRLKRSCQTEISNFERAIVRDQQVGSFHVTVNYIILLLGKQQANYSTKDDLHDACIQCPLAVVSCKA